MKDTFETLFETPNKRRKYEDNSDPTKVIRILEILPDELLAEAVFNLPIP